MLLENNFCAAPIQSEAIIIEKYNNEIFAIWDQMMEREIQEASGKYEQDKNDILAEIKLREERGEKSKIAAPAKRKTLMREKSALLAEILNREEMLLNRARARAAAKAEAEQKPETIIKGALARVAKQETRERRTSVSFHDTVKIHQLGSDGIPITTAAPVTDNIKPPPKKLVKPENEFIPQLPLPRAQETTKEVEEDDGKALRPKVVAPISLFQKVEAFNTPKSSDAPDIPIFVLPSPRPSALEHLAHVSPRPTSPTTNNNSPRKMITTDIPTPPTPKRSFKREEAKPEIPKPEPLDPESDGPKHEYIDDLEVLAMELEISSVLARYRQEKLELWSEIEHREVAEVEYRCEQEKQELLEEIRRREEIRKVVRKARRNAVQYQRTVVGKMLEEKKRERRQHDQQAVREKVREMILRERQVEKETLRMSMEIDAVERKYASQKVEVWDELMQREIQEVTTKFNEEEQALKEEIRRREDIQTVIKRAKRQSRSISRNTLQFKLRQ